MPRPHLSLLRPDCQASERDTSLSERSDDELMLLARGGKDAAFDVLVRRHQARAMRVAARLLGTNALAPDVVQNTFLAIYRSISQYQHCGRFTAYLYAVLLNQCRMVRRSSSAEKEALAGLDLASSEGYEPSDKSILTRELQRQLERALQRLGPKLQDVVVLRYCGDLSHGEIAEALAAPVGTVKRRLFDAMAKLRGVIEGP